MNRSLRATAQHFRSRPAPGEVCTFSSSPARFRSLGARLPADEIAAAGFDS